MGIVLQSVLVVRLFVVGVKGYRQATLLFTDTPRTIDAFFLFVSSYFFAFHDNFLAFFLLCIAFRFVHFREVTSKDLLASRKAGTNRRLNCPLIDFASDANEQSPSIDGGTSAITEKLNNRQSNELWDGLSVQLVHILPLSSGRVESEPLSRRAFIDKFASMPTDPHGRLCGKRGKVRCAWMWQSLPPLHPTSSTGDCWRICGV